MDIFLTTPSPLAMSPSDSTLADSTLGLILAGGRARRMGGRDKSFTPLGGRPMIEHVLERLTPQVAELAISSNAEASAYAAYGLPVLADRLTGHLGPLAGVHAALHAYPDRPVISVAVDLPFLPTDLVERLRTAGAGWPCAYASDGQRHALALWWAPGQAADIEDYLQRGGRRLDDWLTRRGNAVLFDRPGDDDLFLNINTPDDLALAERRLQALP